MDKLEILNQIKSKRLEIAQILDSVATDKRDVTNVEKINMESLKSEITELETRLANANSKPQTIIGKLGTENEKFQLTSFFRNLADGKNFSDVENEVLKLGQDSFKGSGLSYRGATLPLNFEKRTLAAGTTGAGAEIVAEEKFDLLLPLRAKNVLAQAGATVLDNLVGNISIPIFTGSTASWKGENITAGDGGGGFIEKEFSPKRLTVYLPVSKLLLIQNSVGAEQKLQQDLVNAINSKLEETLLGASAGTSTQPAGIFYGATVTVTGATSFANVVNLETTINTNNADYGNLKYIVHPATLGKMKTTPKTANTASFIAENNQVNGYSYITTTHIPAIETGKGVIFGNWSDLYLCFWSGLDVTVDTLTGAKDGIVNYIINLYVDGGAVRTESFASGWQS